MSGPAVSIPGAITWVTIARGLETTDEPGRVPGTSRRAFAASFPERLVERWDAPARPLLWSHASYLLGLEALDPARS